MSEALDVWSGTEVEIAGQQLETYEDHVVAWHHLDGEEDDLNWIRGAVVASLVVKYGEETIPRYAKDVGRPISTIKLYRQTFKAYQQEDEKAKRLAFSGLKWWHYVIALRAPEEDRPAILELAATTRCPDHANGDDPVAGHLPWRGRELARYIAERFKQPSPPLPPGTFTTIVADPPWPYDAGWPEYADAAGDKNPRRPLPYQPMSIEEISGLDVLGLAAPDSHLFLWTTNRYVRDAYAVAESWGFEPSQLLVWCKKPRGIGPGGGLLEYRRVHYLRPARITATQGTHRFNVVGMAAREAQHEAECVP